MRTGPSSAPRPGAAVTGVVPLTHDDRDAPGGCAALRELGGRTLLSRAVDTLARSGRVARVFVPAPPALLPAMTALLRADLPAGMELQVVPVLENGPGARVRAVLTGAAALVVADPDAVVVVHDPLHPLAPTGLVDAVLEAFEALDVLGAAPADGVVPVGPVTDTLKRIDEDDVVIGTADRQAYRTVVGPQAYRAAALLAALAGASDESLRAGGADVLPGLVLATGRAVATVPAPGELFRVATPAELVLAEAVLAESVLAESVLAEAPAAPGGAPVELRAGAADRRPAGARPGAGRGGTSP